MSFHFPGWIQGPLNWVQGIFNPLAHQEQPPAPPAEQPPEPHDPIAKEAAKETPAPVSPPKPFEVATSIEHGISLLKAEQCKRLEEKAHGLNGQVRSVHEKIKNLDKVLSLISQYSQRNPDRTENASGTVDCTIPEIVTAVAALRRDGISVPLPDGILQKGERGHVINVLSNQRNLLSDEQKEHSQEFQQCAVERNSLFQSLMSLISELHRIKIKILGNIHRSAS
jgi:prefoldin subunit 5